MKLSALFLIPLLILFGAHEAKAEGYIRAGAMYLSGKSGNGTLSGTSRTLVDFGGGYVLPAGWTIGALYGTESQTYTPTGTPENRTSFGPTVGWMKPGEEGAFLLASYFLTTTLNTYKGTGYQVDVGYKFPINRVSAAMQISYKRFKYNEISSSPVDPPYEQEYFDPYFMLFVSL